MSATRRHFTIAEYLALEAVTGVRNEFHDGEIRALPPESIDHSRIVRNTLVELNSALRGKRCKNFESNLRVGIPSAGRVLNSDGIVICGPLEFHPEDPVRGTVINPSVVVEVLSPGTEAYDRGDKFELYRRIDSLREYVLICQTQPRIETYVRQAAGAWVYRVFPGLDAVLVLPTVEIEVRLSEIYTDVEFPPPAPILEHER